MNVLLSFKSYAKLSKIVLVPDGLTTKILSSSTKSIANGNTDQNSSKVDDKTSVGYILASVHQNFSISLHPHPKTIILDDFSIISSAQCQTTKFDDKERNR